MSTTVPTFGKTAAQLDGLACIDCSRDDTVQQPTGDRGPTGAQLVRCSGDCPADGQSGAPVPTSAVVLVERQLPPEVLLLCEQERGIWRATFDPAKITAESARELVAEASSLYPDARGAVYAAQVHTVITSIPADEPPLQIEQHANGCTVTYDDARVTGEQLRAIVGQAATL